MKKLFFVFICLFCLKSKVLAGEIYSVDLVKCDSLANIWIKKDDQIKRIHLLAFESESGKLDNEINEYACSQIKNAKKLAIEYDAMKQDKYNRDLVYLYVDNKLLQEELISKGYGQVANITTYLRETKKLCDVQKNAIETNIGIWDYPNIKEKYCNSGINIQNKEEEKEKIQEEYDISNIKYIIFLNSGILVLLILMKRD